jgi:hypothetical protein
MARHSVGFAGRHIKLPRSRRWRIVIGIALILGGFVGFLPILGFWMIPLGGDGGGSARVRHLAERRTMAQTASRTCRASDL